MHARTGKLVLFWMILVVMTLYGCTGRGGPAPTQPAGEATEGLLNYTQAAETISAELTRVAPPTQDPQAQAAPTLAETEEALPSTSTPLPTATPLPTDTPLPTATSLPTDTPIPLESPTATNPPEPAWQLEYTDDFTSARSWSEDRGERFRLDFASGGYRITNDVVGDIIYSTRTGSYGPVRVETNARWLSGPLDSYFGVVCHFTNGGNYYMFAAGADGWYGIVKKQMSQIIVLKEGMDTTGTVQIGQNGMAIRGDCYNGQLVLWINGVQMLSVRDASFTGGSVGLAVGARKTGGAQILFDNFSVYTVPPQAPALPTASATP